jgi:hypothetical protein
MTMTTAHSPLETQSPNIASLALDMLFSPGQAAQRLAQRRRTLLFSLVTFITAFTALWLVYYRLIDFAWLKDFLTDMAVRMHPGISPSQVRQSMNSIPLPAMIASTLVGGLATVFIEILARTIYHHLIAHVISEREVAFGSWAALVTWSILPNALMLLLALANLCYVDATHLSPSQVTLSSLNAVFLHLPTGHPWAMWAGAIDMRILWTVAITAGGLSAWLGISRSKAWFWASLPYLGFFGTWALFVLL